MTTAEDDSDDVILQEVRLFMRFMLRYGERQNREQVVRIMERPFRFSLVSGGFNQPTDAYGFMLKSHPRWAVRFILKMPTNVVNHEMVDFRGRKTRIISENMIMLPGFISEFERVRGDNRRITQNSAEATQFYLLRYGRVMSDIEFFGSKEHLIEDMSLARMVHGEEIISLE